MLYKQTVALFNFVILPVDILYKTREITLLLRYTHKIVHIKLKMSELCLPVCQPDFPMWNVTCELAQVLERWISSRTRWSLPRVRKTIRL